jgi:hypothetical protein
MLPRMGLPFPLELVFYKMSLRRRWDAQSECNPSACRDEKVLRNQQARIWLIKTESV